MADAQPGCGCQGCLHYSPQPSGRPLWLWVSSPWPGLGLAGRYHASSCISLPRGGGQTAFVHSPGPGETHPEAGAAPAGSPATGRSGWGRRGCGVWGSLTHSQPLQPDSGQCCGGGSTEVSFCPGAKGGACWTPRMCPSCSRSSRKGSSGWRRMSSSRSSTRSPLASRSRRPAICRASTQVAGPRPERPPLPRLGRAPVGRSDLLRGEGCARPCASAGGPGPGLAQPDSAPRGP